MGATEAVCHTAINPVFPVKCTSGEQGPRDRCIPVPVRLHSIAGEGRRANKPPALGGSSAGHRWPVHTQSLLRVRGWLLAKGIQLRARSLTLVQPTPNKDSPSSSAIWHHSWTGYTAEAVPKPKACEHCGARGATPGKPYSNHSNASPTPRTLSTIARDV